MTNRNMSAGLITETEKDMVQYYECVNINVGIGYNITNAPWDITHNGITYNAVGALLSFEAIEENSNFDIEQLNIVVGGIEPMPADNEPFIKVILSLDYVDRPVAITRVYFNMDSQVDGVLLYSGYINSVVALSGIGEDGASVNIQTSNNWSNFGKRTSRFTNDSSQQSTFPGDLGFEFSKQVQKQVEWKEPV